MGAEYIFPPMIMFDPMAELQDDAPVTDDAGSSATDNTSAPSADSTPARSAPARSGGGGGKFSTEVHSVTIHARQRTFYIDLKQSNNGQFFKVSEKSRGGQKTTIMFDAEDLDQFIAAFQEMKAHV